MKKIILLFLIGALTFNSYAQSNSVTAGLGLLNTKVRVQLEHGFNDNMSTGANLSYYMVNWKGPRLEGFYRIYFGDDNERGMFAQAKAGAGLFSNVWDGDDLTFTNPTTGMTYDVYDSNTWMTVGGGIAFGGKITTRGGFVFETTLGYHFWTPPTNQYSSDYDDYYDDALNTFETIGYYVVGPGFPLDMQVKFGFNF
jgi:hypothetical protein|tara:strand:+ start:237 stop:827 length:591 start_codon:yes stop_codon:yes gene_type:complete